LSGILKVGKRHSKGIPTTGGIDRGEPQPRDPRNGIYGMDSNIVDRAPMLARLEISCRAATEHQWVLTSEGNGVNLANHAPAHQLSEPNALRGVAMIQHTADFQSLLGGQLRNLIQLVQAGAERFVTDHVFALGQCLDD